MAKKRVNLKALLEADKIETVDVDVSKWMGEGAVQTLGALDALSMIEWTDGNREDPAKRKVAGLRMMVRSLLDEEGKRIPEEEVDAVVESFKSKSNALAKTLTSAALLLNGVTTEKRDDAKNESGEALKDASPIDSPSALVSTT